MGLILDTSILIAGERRKQTFRQIIEHLQAAVGETEAALSVVSVVELNHGVFRAKTSIDRERRKVFCDEVCRNMIVHDVSVGIARLAGKIEGEQAAQGVSVAFQDLLIGATALHLGFGVATLNLRHFQAIPGLEVVSL